MIKYKLLIILLLIPSIVSADNNASTGTITRIFDKSWYNITDNITVLFTATGADFNISMISEILPGNFTVTPYPGISYTQPNFTVLISLSAAPTPIYKLTPSLTTPTDKWYNITGTFKDADTDHGNISTTKFYIVGNNTLKMKTYDTSNNNLFEKTEAIASVAAYFSDTPTIDFDTTILIVNTYMNHAHILPVP